MKHFEFYTPVTTIAKNPKHEYCCICDRPRFPGPGGWLLQHRKSKEYWECCGDCYDDFVNGKIHGEYELGYFEKIGQVLDYYRGIPDISKELT